MRPYLDLLDNILTKGRRRETPRNGSYTLGIFGEQLRFNLADGFPLVTTRKVPMRGIIEELLWFLSGSTNNEDLVAKNVHIWDQWAIPETVKGNRPLTIVERQNLYRKLFNEKSPQHQDGPFGYMTKPQTKQTEWPPVEHMNLVNIPTTVETVMYAKGDLGPIYGQMWRAWPNPNGPAIDQISTLMYNLKTKPYSRRHIVSAWNPTLLPDETMDPVGNVYHQRQCLPPCHTLFQFSVEPLTFDERMDLYEKRFGPEALYEELMTSLQLAGDRIESTPSSEIINEFLNQKNIPKDRLSCKLHARSQDVPIGTVFNIASYATLVLMISKLLNFAPGEYIHSMGDSHIYENQIDLVREQLKREPRPLPTLKIVGDPESLFDYSISDFKLEGYNPHPVINYPITV